MMLNKRIIWCYWVGVTISPRITVSNYLKLEEQQTATTYQSFNLSKFQLIKTLVQQIPGLVCSTIITGGGGGYRNRAAVCVL